MWICGKTKMNELIEVPESADAYVPLSDFLGGALPVLNALKVVPPAIKYRVMLKEKNGKGEIKLGVVENEVDVQAIRSKIRGRLTDRKLKSAGSGVKPPTMKKFKRTVVFYEGEIIKTEMGGLTRVPRHYVYHGSWQNRTTAEERWKALAKKAEEQDREELAVEAENQRRMDEYRRKADGLRRFARRSCWRVCLVDLACRYHTTSSSLLGEWIAFGVWGSGRSPNSKNLCASLCPLCGKT